jgi:hypothetical protein
MSDPPKTPPELDAAMRVVLAYKPKKAKAKTTKKRNKINKKNVAS